MRAGKLRHRCTIEHFVKTSAGDRGQPVGSWQTLYAGVWADVEDLTGKQAEVSRQLVASATHQVTIRWHSGVLPGMRLRASGGQFDGRNLVIGHAGDGEGRKHDLILTCTEQKTGAT